MSSALNVRQVGMEEAAACREFIYNHPQGSIYHTWEWQQAIQAGLPTTMTPCYWVAYQGSTIVGLLPAVVEKVFEQPVLRTVPWGRTVQTALLSTSWAASEALLDTLYASCLQYNAMSAELLLPASEEREYFSARVGKSTRIFPRFTQVVMLPDNYDTQWSEVYDNKTRNILRKARREVTLRRAQDESSLHAYYQLYRDTMSYTENNHHTYPESLLMSLWRHLPDHLELVEAYHDSELIGGAVFVHWKDQVHYWSAAGLRQFRPFNATSHIVDSAIQRAITQGCRQLNMGPSITYGSSLYHFKQQFGAVYMNCDIVVAMFRPDGLTASSVNNDAALHVGHDDGLVEDEWRSLTPRRRISLSKRQVSEKGTWLVYVVDGAEEARLAAEIQSRGMDFDPNSLNGHLLRLNGAGLAIWELCDGTVSIAEMAQEIEQHFAISHAKAMTDVVTFVQALAQQDLIDLAWTPL